MAFQLRIQSDPRLFDERKKYSVCTLALKICIKIAKWTLLFYT